MEGGKLKKHLEDRLDFELETMKENVASILEQDEGEPVVGESLHWYNNFIGGIATRKDFFLTALRFMKPEFLAYDIYAEAYRFYVWAYKETGRYPAIDDISEMAGENRDMTDLDRDRIDLIVEMSIRESGGMVTDEQFELAMDRIIERKKSERFDTRVLESAKYKKKGNIQRADEVLETYLNEFKHLQNREMPIAMSKDAWQLSEGDGHTLYSYESGFDKIDRVTGGGFRGETWVVGGYTSDGKTNMTKEMVFKNLLRRETVLWVSLEMNNREMMALFATRIAQDMGCDRLTLNKIRRRDFSTDEEREQFARVITEMKKFDNLILYNPSGKFTIRDLEMEIDRIQAKQDLDIVVVDYLELLDSVRGYKDYRIEVKETMRVAKRLANEKDVWLIIPHQISREGRKKAKERRPFPHYIPQDLQESSGVEQNCVVMVWTYQDEFYKKEHRVRMGVSKNRMGKTDTVGWELGADFSRCVYYEDGMTLIGRIEVGD